MDVHIREMSTTPGKLLSTRYSKQVGVGGVDEDGVKSHTILLVIFHYKNPKAEGGTWKRSLKPVLLHRANIFTHSAHVSYYRGSILDMKLCLYRASLIPLGFLSEVHFQHTAILTTTQEHMRRVGLQCYLI